MALATPLHLTPRRIRGVRRVMAAGAAVLGVLVLVLGPLATHHHLTQQVHAICEHGAEIHVERDDGHVPAADPGAGALAAVRDGSRSPLEADHGDHHHCTAQSGVTAAPTVQSAGTGATEVAAAVAPPPAPAPARAAALFRLAPKTSPPV